MVGPPPLHKSLSAHFRAICLLFSDAAFERERESFPVLSESEGIIPVLSESLSLHSALGFGLPPPVNYANKPPSVRLVPATPHLAQLVHPGLEVDSTSNYTSLPELVSDHIVQQSLLGLGLVSSEKEVSPASSVSSQATVSRPASIISRDSAEFSFSTLTLPEGLQIVGSTFTLSEPLYLVIHSEHMRDIQIRQRSVGLLAIIKCKHRFRPPPSADCQRKGKILYVLESVFQLPLDEEFLIHVPPGSEYELPSFP